MFLNKEDILFNIDFEKDNIYIYKNYKTNFYISNKLNKLDSLESDLKLLFDKAFILQMEDMILGYSNEKININEKVEIKKNKKEIETTFTTVYSILNDSNMINDFYNFDDFNDFNIKGKTAFVNELLKDYIKEIEKLTKNNNYTVIKRLKTSIDLILNLVNASINQYFKDVEELDIDLTLKKDIDDLYCKINKLSDEIKEKIKENENLHLYEYFEENEIEISKNFEKTLKKSYIKEISKLKEDLKKEIENLKDEFLKKIF